MLDIPGLHEQAVKKSGVCESQNDFIHAALSLCHLSFLIASISSFSAVICSSVKPSTRMMYFVMFFFCTVKRMQYTATDYCGFPGNAL